MVRSDPCWRCGARGSCRHREVADEPLPPFARQFDGRANLSSPWGAKGNPAGKARARMLEGLKAQVKAR